MSFGRYIVVMPPRVAEPIRAFGCAKHKILAEQILDHLTDRVTVKQVVIDLWIMLKEPHHPYGLVNICVWFLQPWSRGLPQRPIKRIGVGVYLIQWDEVLQKNKS